MIIENKLIINNGVISMVDGSDLQQYLMDWQIEQGIANGAVVNVIENKTLRNMWFDAKYGCTG